MKNKLYRIPPVSICRKRILEDLHSIDVPYLNGAVPTISCSHSGFDPLKRYWRIATSGAEGFRAQAERVLARTAELKAALAERGVETLMNPWSNMVCVPRPAPETVHRYCMACCDCRFFGAMAHVVVMPYFTPGLIRHLADDITRSSGDVNAGPELAAGKTSILVATS